MGRGQRSGQTEKLHARGTGKGHSNQAVGAEMKRPGVEGHMREEGITAGYSVGDSGKGNMPGASVGSSAQGSPQPPQPESRSPHDAHLFERGLHERAQLGQDLFDLHQDLEGKANCERGDLGGKHGERWVGGLEQQGLP